MRFILSLLSLLLVPTLSLAATGDIVNDESTSSATEESTSIPEGSATIIIEQVTINGSRGTWILSTPDHTKIIGGDESETIANTPSGNYVIYSNLPSGAISTIRIYKNGILDRYLERQQTPFSAYPGDTIRIVIHYRLDKIGTISVQSDPPGTVFTLTGPEDFIVTDVTPQTYQGLPEGQYKVQYERFAEGCVEPAPKADRLIEDGRIAFNIRFDCDAATKIRERLQNETQKYLTIIVDGTEVQLQDVLQKDWFSTYIFEAAKRNILSGYRDDAGNLTGTFGPSNNVTVAELSKIAHRLAGLSEEAFLATSPKNITATNQWFSPFIASSENRGWIIYAAGTIDPIRPATRGEVLVTLMQAFEVPLTWQKGNVFTDVPVTHPYAAAIETAANAAVISGRSDADGKSTGIFDPEAPITRAEISKIITTMLSTYKSPTTLRNSAGRQALN